MFNKKECWIRKEKFVLEQLELNKTYSLFEFKRVEFELNFNYMELSSNSNLYTRLNLSSNSNSTESVSDQVRI